MMIAGRRNNSWRIVIEIFLILIALVIGYFIHPISNLEVVPKASIVDYANIIIAITALLFIPYYIEKKLKEKRVIKDLLIEDIKEIMNEVDVLRKVVNNCATESITTKTDKAEILGLLRNISNSNTQIISMIESVFGEKKVKSIKETLNTLSKKIWDEITEGDLMKEDFQIDDEFSSMTSNICFRFVSKYKIEVVKINNL